MLYLGHSTVSVLESSTEVVRSKNHYLLKLLVLIEGTPERCSNLRSTNNKNVDVIEKKCKTKMLKLEKYLKSDCFSKTFVLLLFQSCHQSLCSHYIKIHCSVSFD
jgi:hypothetical protein